MTSLERVWVRSCHEPTAKLSPKKSINLIGGNQGNLLYQFSTHRALVRDDVDLQTITYAQFGNGDVDERAARINSGCDRLVLPLSSSFRLQNRKGLEDWADLIERLDVPVTVVGIGAQLRLEDVRSGSFIPSRVTGVTASKRQVRRHEEAARRFVAAVLERSESIGVRGDVTKNYLQYLGFPEDRIDVIGCPSLFMWGPEFQMPNEPVRLNRRSALSLSFDHRVLETADLLDKTFNAYPKSRAYMQEKLGIRMIVSGEETRADWEGDERFPVKTSHRLYGQRRLEYYPTAWSWIRSLRDVDFAYGPRLHGTVAATLAGTSAHLLVHDSRTYEVAEHHRLPYTLTEDLNTVKSAADLAARQDYTAFNEHYPELFGRFTAFLERNSLKTAYGEPSDALRAFDESLEPSAQLPGVLSGPAPNKPIRRALGKARRALGV